MTKTKRCEDCVFFMRVDEKTGRTICMASKCFGQEHYIKLGMTKNEKVLKRALEMAILAWHKNDCHNCLPFNINDGGEFECGIDDRRNCIKKCSAHFIRKAQGELK